jgi:site-specific DNA-methyltransferase (adenine-specific)
LQIRDSSNLLAKGTPPLPGQPPPDVIDWTYSGNRLHPTQKPVPCLKPLIAAFTQPGDIGTIEGDEMRKKSWLLSR